MEGKDQKGRVAITGTGADIKKLIKSEGGETKVADLAKEIIEAGVGQSASEKHHGEDKPLDQKPQ